jgi:hypothetical protein
MERKSGSVGQYQLEITSKKLTDHSASPLSRGRVAGYENPFGVLLKVRPVFGIEPRPFAGDNSGGTRAASPHLHYNEFLSRGVVEKLGRGTAISRANGQWGAPGRGDKFRWKARDWR